MKHLKIAGAPVPPVPSAGPDEAAMQAIIKQAVPLSATVEHGGGLMLHPQTMSVYVVGRHPLSITPTVIRVPLSAWLSIGVAILVHMVVPSLAQSEHAGVKPAQAE